VGARASLYSRCVREPPFRTRVNGDIRGTPSVELITSPGERVGIVPLADALRRALAEGGDLVEVRPDRTPPVCKIVGKRSDEERARAGTAQGESWDAGLTIRVHLPTSFSLVSSDLILVMPAFEAYGRQGTGYGWQAVAQHLVDTEIPEIAPVVVAPAATS
jgi:hypothetical protein